VSASLLGLAAEGIATIAYYEASVAIPSPSRGQERAFDAIAQLVVTGHGLVANRQYVEACEKFRQATQKALAIFGPPRAQTLTRGCREGVQ
jgi:hypothetical protein